jgi:putative Mg2+ transporter-C (MgtC) family protein
VHFPSQLELGLRILLAMALGGLVGFERELAGHPAGLRTHISVALGAALFAVISAYGFQAFNVPRNDTIYQVDVTRIASQIVVGVGFLGGGTILKEGASVRGLTTAASLWVTAAIGTGAALGAAGPSIIATGALLGSLVVLRVPRKWLRSRVAQQRENVVVRLHPGAGAEGIVSAIYALEGVTVRELRLRTVHGAVEVHTYLVGAHGIDVDAKVAALTERSDVASLDTE